MTARHKVVLHNDVTRPWTVWADCQKDGCRWSWGGPSCGGVGSYEWAKTNHEKANDEPEYPVPEPSFAERMYRLSREAAFAADECRRRGDAVGRARYRGLSEGYGNAAIMAPRDEKGDR